MGQYHRMLYERHRTDPRWQRKRLKILERDYWTCRRCFNDKIELHVHHLKYGEFSRPWDLPDRYFVTLCAECHESWSNTWEKPCLLRGEPFVRAVRDYVKTQNEMWLLENDIGMTGIDSAPFGTIGEMDWKRHRDFYDQWNTHLAYLELSLDRIGIHIHDG